MEEMKSHFKGVFPFLCVTCAFFVYIEDYSENEQYNLWTLACFSISKAVWAEICAFTTWKGLYHFKLAENEIFDLLVIHVFCIPATMVIMLPSLHWLLKLSLVFAIFLTLLVVRVLLGSFKQFKRLGMQASSAFHRSSKIEKTSSRNLPRTIFNKKVPKAPIPKVNVQIPNGASGDTLLNSFSTLAAQTLTKGTSEYRPAVLNCTSTEPVSKSQEPPTSRISKSTQVGVSTTSMVESSTSTSSSYPAWNALAIGNREEAKYNSTSTDSVHSKNSQMSVSQVSVSTQANNATPTSSAWRVLEYKTRNGKVYKAILCNEKAGISRPIDPDILYGNDGKSDYTGNS